MDKAETQQSDDDDWDWVSSFATGVYQGWGIASGAIRTSSESTDERDQIGSHLASRVLKNGIKSLSQVFSDDRIIQGDEPEGKEDCFELGADGRKTQSVNLECVTSELERGNARPFWKYLVQRDDTYESDLEAAKEIDRINGERREADPSLPDIVLTSSWLGGKFELALRRQNDWFGSKLFQENEIPIWDRRSAYDGIFFHYPGRLDGCYELRSYFNNGKLVKDDYWMP